MTSSRGAGGRDAGCRDAGVQSLVSSIKQHQNFRQLASYSVQCLLRAITPPLRAAALLAVLAAAGPAGAWTIESRVAPPQPAPMPQFVVPQNCTAQPAVAISDGMSQMVTCAGVPLTISVRVLPPRINPNRILAAWRTLTGEDTASDTEFDSIDIPGHSPEHWRLTTTEEPGWVTASVLWLNGVSAGGGLRDRATQARASIFGASSAPVLASVSFHSGRVQALMGEREAAEKAIRGFLAAQTDLGAQITALAIAAAK